MPNSTTTIRDLDILQQLNNLIPALGPAYTQPVEAIGNSSIGDHIRHLLEFYQCLFEAIEKGVEVDYESRKRNVSIASQPEVALLAIDHLHQNLIQIIEDQPLRVQGVPSSLGRELQYAFDHAVHHCALIKAGLFFLDLKHLVPDDFGVSPSTIRYRNGQVVL